MSSHLITLYCKVTEPGHLRQIKKFMALLEEENYEAIEAIDEAAVLFDIEDVVLLHHQALPDNLLCLKLDTAPSFELEGLHAFLQNLGAEEIEMLGFSTQVGEYFFMQNGELLDRYHETQWHYLKDPSQAFFDQTVVVTGTFAEHDRAAIETLVTANGGKVQQAVNGKTTLLIVGSKPGRSKLDKATELGIPTLDAAEFWRRIEETQTSQATGED
ncbi:BRCT domain-containing protein [Chitinimonas lacunae]|uniref:BRCT domain-containing protein n=1 Tax=Chitinimonas lacunae TaxID=1963018 RepID=A0ABV8MM60_9NEIS